MTTGVLRLKNEVSDQPAACVERGQVLVSPDTYGTYKYYGKYGISTAMEWNFKELRTEYLRIGEVLKAIHVL